MTVARFTESDLLRLRDNAAEAEIPASEAVGRKWTTQGEHNFQQVAFDYCVKALRGIAPVWSIDCGWPNDGSEKASQILRARRRRGILPGYPDLWIMSCPAVTLETKPRKGRGLSSAQLDRRAELLRMGHHWHGPVTTLEQVEAILVAEGFLIRARLQSGLVPALPQPSARVLARWARLHDPIPDLRPGRHLKTTPQDPD